MLTIIRLSTSDREHAQRLFSLMSDVFGEEASPLSGAYLERLLSERDFWAIAAYDDGALVGGLTAHTLPMTRREAAELFIYDIAVVPNSQRRGVGRALVETLRRFAEADGVSVVFVAADTGDQHAVDFYVALGATAAPVTMFTMGEQS